MSRVPKFIKGRLITSVQQVMDEFEGERFIFYRHKPLHWGWYGSWGLITIRRFILCKHLYFAVPNSEYKKKGENDNG